jgi:hypothetical protein
MGAEMTRAESPPRAIAYVNHAAPGRIVGRRPTHRQPVTALARDGKPVFKEGVPVLKEGQPALKRRMSELLDKGTAPRPAEGKRRFFRTWVRAVPQKKR